MPIVLVRDSETVVMFVTLQLDVRAATLDATNTTLVQCHVMLEISWSQSVWNSYILPSIQEKSKTLHPIDGFMDASLRLFLLVKYTNFERIEVEKYLAWLSNREHDVAWHRTEVVLRIAAWLLYVPTKCISIARTTRTWTPNGSMTSMTAVFEVETRARTIDSMSCVQCCGNGHEKRCKTNKSVGSAHTAHRTAR